MNKINVESNLTRLGRLVTRALLGNYFIYSGAQRTKTQNNEIKETTETKQPKRATRNETKP